jgi:hypothetical protein
VSKENTKREETFICKLNNVFLGLVFSAHYFYYQRDSKNDLFSTQKVYQEKVKFHKNQMGVAGLGAAGRGTFH